MKQKRLLALVGVVGLLAAALWLHFGTQAPQTAAETTGATASNPFPSLPQRKAVAAAEHVTLSDEDRSFIATLRGKFAAHINNRHAQIKAIEQVIAYLMERYPDDWQSRVREFLAQLFPELAEQLYAEFEKLIGFNDWLKEHRSELSQMGAQDRRRALWDARHAAFGDAAEEIWQGEIRNERLIDSLAEVGRSQGSVDEKLTQFVDAVHKAYGDGAQRYIDGSQTELMNRFVSVPSVQAQLGAMSRSEQHATLRRMRTAMGLDNEALQRWDTLDAARDQAWDTGQSYQLQRAAILAQYQGSEQAQRLTALQDQLFGAEADTIRSEEAAGFFRYASARRVGRE